MMPKYVYQCEKCNTKWEELIGMKADNPPCPECESKKVEKLMPTRFAIRTDATYSAGRKTILEQCDGVEHVAKRMVATLRAQGYEPGMHDFYEPGLADFAYDAKAMIPQSDPRGTMAKRCLARGVEILDGPAGLNINGGKRPMKRGGKRLANHLVENLRRQKLERDPSLVLRDQQEIRHDIIQKHGSEISEG